MNISPILAIAITVVFTLATVRTANIESQFRQNRVRLGIRHRSYFFVRSIGLVFNTVAIAAIAFSGICIGCALLAYGFAVLMQPGISPKELAFIGAASGVVWGAVGGVVCVGWYWHQRWIPDLDYASTEHLPLTTAESKAA